MIPPSIGANIELSKFSLVVLALDEDDDWSMLALFVRRSLQFNKKLCILARAPVLFFNSKLWKKNYLF